MLAFPNFFISVSSSKWQFIFQQSIVTHLSKSVSLMGLGKRGKRGDTRRQQQNPTNLRVQDSICSSVSLYYNSTLASSADILWMQAHRGLHHPSASLPMKISILAKDRSSKCKMHILLIKSIAFAAATATKEEAAGGILLAHH